MTTEQIARSHASTVTTEQLEAFCNQLAAKSPAYGSRDYIRLETYSAELRGRIG